MHNQTYDEYIRSILGYQPINNSQNYETYNMVSNNNNPVNVDNELEQCYPEIYKVVYPMVVKACRNTRGNVTKETLENMTDEIYSSLEGREEIELNINLRNDVRTTSTKQVDKKAEVSVKNSTDNRETRQFNRGLRDLIKILLLRELLNRPGFPHRPPRPGPGPGPRPPFIPGRPPFPRDFDSRKL